MTIQAEIARIEGLDHFFNTQYILLRQKIEMTTIMTEEEDRQLIKLLRIVQDDYINTPQTLADLRLIINNMVLPEGIQNAWNNILNEAQCNGKVSSVTQKGKNESEEIKKGDIVYIKELPQLYREFASREQVLNSHRELIVQGKIGKEICYSDTITNNLTKSYNIYHTTTEESVERAQPVSKRKFVLEKDLGKYKKGTVFSRAQLIKEFGKFQLAKNIYIYNKLYICAE